jgi:hypothetical protein
MKKFLFILSIFFLHTTAAQAALVSVVAPQAVSGTKQFSVLVYLDTNGTSVNSFDISLSYPKELVTFQGYKEDGSIKKSWFLSPTDESGAIHFVGIIPGGVDGVYDPDKSGLEPIPIASLLFSPKSSGSGKFILTHSDIRQNDGAGTSLAHKDKNASIIISLNPNEAEENEKDSFDLKPPEPFTIEYIPASFLSKTPSMIVFFTTDSESGVKKYQMQNLNNSWKDVISPWPVRKGILKRDVTIRAIDFNGNVREARAELPGLLSGLQLLALFIFGVLCYFIFFVVKRRR